MFPLGNDRWQALSPYLDTALELDDDDRARWIAGLRASDPATAADIEALLGHRASIEQSAFLAQPPAAFQQPHALAGLAVGAYTLTSLIGQGGMGSVWLAERSDGRFEGRAAVKLLNAGLIGGAGGERFTREGSILARLNHPCVARLLDAGVSSLGQPYLVLEYVEGEHIDRYCDRQGLGVDARARLFLDVLDAVAHAHANLTVHRDIKPSNVLVTGDGRVKLLDFGIAKLIADPDAAESAALTVDGARVLTPEYAAPEQMTGAPITIATDVYALGVLLYVLLVGRHPAGQATTTPAELLKAIVETEPAPPSQVAASAAARRALKGDLDNIVAKAMKKDPAQRYASVGAFADDLRRYFSHQPVSARPDRWTYRTVKALRRHVAAVTVVLLFAAGAAGMSAFHTARLTTERDRARLEAEKSARMTDLLTGLLTAADPYREDAAREPTVRQLLDAGARQVDTDLAGQPALQAGMLTVMGRVYQRLGVHEQARTLLEKALALADSQAAADPPLRAEILTNLGVLQRETGDASAAATLEEAAGVRRAVLGPEHPDLAETMVELGRAYVHQGLIPRAEPLFREALAIRRKALGDDHRDTATSLSDLALLLWEKGDSAGAEPLFEQVLAINRKTVGNDHPNTSSSLNNLALIAMEQGNWPKAEARLREALEISGRTLGEEHPGRAAQMSNLTHALREQGKYEEALATIEEALKFAGPTLGPDHVLMPVLHTSLARVHVDRGDGVAAEPVARDLLAARRRAFAENDWRVAAAKSLLGVALALQGRLAEAERLLLEARKDLKDVPGPEGREATLARTRLASLYEASGRPEEAAAIRSSLPALR